jgi:hypothetical protein
MQHASKEESQEKKSKTRRARERDGETAVSICMYLPVFHFGKQIMNSGFFKLTLL